MSVPPEKEGQRLANENRAISRNLRKRNLNPLIYSSIFFQNETGSLGDAAHVLAEIQAKRARQEQTPVYVDPLTQLIQEPQNSDIIGFSENLKQKIRFHEIDRDLAISNVSIRLERVLKSGEIENYEEKLKEQADQSGKLEALSYGIGRINGRDFVAIFGEWDFFRGSISVVTAEKVLRALELAEKRDLPVIAVISSGGVRQQEGSAGLIQMPRTIDAIRRFREHTDLPFITVVDESWGGASASIVPKGDVSIGVRGVNFGFSGPRVIIPFQGRPMSKGAQSVAENYKNRQLDMVIESEDELIGWLGGMFRMHRAIRSVKSRWEAITAIGRQSEEYVQGYVRRLPEIHRNNRERFPFGEVGFYNTDRHFDAIEAYQIPKKSEEPPKQYSFEEYEAVRIDPTIADAEFLMRHAFTEVVPFFTSYRGVDRVGHPDIIAGLVLIHDRPYLFVGNQHSYYVNQRGELAKIYSSPRPEDFEYHQRMLAVGERYGIPLISFVDTLGARPDEESEKRQSRAIANSIDASNTYKGRSITFVRVLGSGGGLALYAMGIRIILPNGREFVAEPRSAANIMYEKPTLADVIRTHDTMGATPDILLELGLVDEILEVLNNNYPEDPYNLARAIRNRVVTADLQTEHLTLRQIEGFKERALARLRGRFLSRRHSPEE